MNRLAQLQMAWDEEAAARATVRYLRRRMATPAHAGLAAAWTTALLLAAAQLALLPALAAALTRIAA